MKKLKFLISKQFVKFYIKLLLDHILTLEKHTTRMKNFSKRYLNKVVLKVLS